MFTISDPDSVDRHEITCRVMAISYPLYFLQFFFCCCYPYSAVMQSTAANYTLHPPLPQYKAHARKLLKWVFLIFPDRNPLAPPELDEDLKRWMSCRTTRFSHNLTLLLDTDTQCFKPTKPQTRILFPLNLFYFIGNILASPYGKFQSSSVMIHSAHVLYIKLFSASSPIFPYSSWTTNRPTLQ